MGVKLEVIVVGGGPAGLAVSACLNREKVSNVVLERDETCAPLWKKRAYDRLKLHLAKQYCELPHMAFPESAPEFVPRLDYVRYLDEYARRFGVSPKFNTQVHSAYFDALLSLWTVMAKDLLSGAYQVFFSKFLVVATGENDRGFVPRLPGLDAFAGTTMHSSHYHNGRDFAGKDVLVLGSGNSGMEIALDLSNSNARTSIVARSPVHILSEDIVKIGMFLLKFLPTRLVDAIAVLMAKWKFGNVSHYGFQTPKLGPFTLKRTTGRTPTIDVGAINKIKSGHIKVFPSVSSIEGNKVKFNNAETRSFDAIIFATGYQNTVRDWLKGGDDLFNEKGMLRQRLPNEYWKGQNCLYCAGFSSRGLFGISQDAQNITRDIVLQLAGSKNVKKNI